MILLPRFHVGNHLSKSPLKIKPHRQKQERENCSPSGGEKELLGFYGRPRGILPRCSPRGKAASQLPAVTTKWGTKREPVTQKPPPWAQTPSSPHLSSAFLCVCIWTYKLHCKMCNRDTALVLRRVGDVHVVYIDFHVFVFAFALVSSLTWE